MQKLTLITAEGLAGTIFTNCLTRAGVEIERIYLINFLRGSFSKKCVSLIKLFTKKSKGFLFYKYLIENKIFNNLIVDNKNLLTIKNIADQNKVPVKTITDTNDIEFTDQFKGLKHSDNIVLSAYGSQIFNNTMISHIKHLWNIHGSYLPYYRGAAPYFWMTFKKDFPCGVTIHKVAPKVDTGEIIKQQIINPEIFDSVFIYHCRCVIAAAKLVIGLLNTTGVHEATKLSTSTSAQIPKNILYGLPKSDDIKLLKKAHKSLFYWNDISLSKKIIYKELFLTPKIIHKKFC